MQSLIMPHWSRWHDPQADEAEFKKWKPRFIKMFFPEGDKAPFLDIALRNSEVTILRSWIITENWEHRDGMLTPEDAIYHARKQADAYKEILQWARHEYGLSDGDLSRIAVETLNEPHLWFDGERPEMLALYNIEFIKQMSKSGIRTVAMNFGVGWATNHDSEADPLQQDIESAIPDYSPFLELFDTIKEHNGWAGVHEYWDYLGGSNNMWGWWGGRFHAINKYVDDLPILITETGVDNGVNWEIANDPNVPSGWMSLISHGRNEEQAEREFVNQLGWYDQQCILAGNIEGIFPFEYDYQNEKWWSFNMRIPSLMDKIYGHMNWVTNEYPNGFSSIVVPNYNTSVPWFVASEPPEDSNPPDDNNPPDDSNPPDDNNPPITQPVDITNIRWQAEEAVRQLEHAIEAINDAHNRLVSEVVSGLVDVENGASVCEHKEDVVTDEGGTNFLVALLSKLFGGM